MNETPVRVAPKIGFVSLGCPKALVDSERIITKLRAEGYELSPSYEGADAVVVNTCGFLNSAKEESLAAIGDALAENGKVIVTGCLGVEADRILARHPDVLAITGPQQYEAVVAEVHKAVPRPHDPFLDLVPPQGIRLTPRHYAYLKISEGVEIMIDKIGKHGAVARSHWDAPEIDGNVYLRGVTRLQPGDRLEVVVHGADAYDLWASPV